MKILLKKNYESNPAFTFEDGHWSIDEKLVQDFERAYGNPREKIRKQKAKVIFKILEEIFETFQLQAQNEFEKAFVQELQIEITKFLTDELYYRFRLKPLRKLADDDRQIELQQFNRFFSSLSPESLQNIQKIMLPEIQRFRENARNNKLKRSDLSSNSGKIVGQINKIVTKEFADQGIFGVISQYVGVKYKNAGVSLELSVEGSTWWKNNQFLGESPKTMYAHLDESIYAPKAIVYLSDVKEYNGPTSGFIGVYEKFSNNPLQDVVGRVIGNIGNDNNSILKNYYDSQYHQSFASENFRKHFMKLPPQLRFNSHLGWDIIPNTELESKIAQTEEVMLGNAGKFVVFDGSKLLHRGGLIEKGERIVLQVVISEKKTIIHRGLKKIKRIYKGG